MKEYRRLKKPCKFSIDNFCTIYKFERDNKFIPCDQKGGCFGWRMWEKVYDVRIREKKEVVKDES